MRKFNYLQFIFVLFSFSSCVHQYISENKESGYIKDRYSAIVQMTPLWTLNYQTNKDNYGNTIDIFPVYSDSILLTCYDSNNKRTLKSVNINTGDLKWNQEITSYPTTSGYTYNDYLFVIESNSAILLWKLNSLDNSGWNNWCNN